jgi:low affinity Fe/Cu permease
MHQQMPARQWMTAAEMKNNSRPKLERLVGAQLLGSFQKFARTVVRTSGQPMAFGLAIGIIVIWALTGPLFRFGNTWLLVINTVANIITFLMIFLIRNAQNRESEAVQLKLDELIRATQAAQNTLLDIEELSEEELDRIKTRFERLARKARDESSAGQTELIRREGRQDAALAANESASGVRH